MVNNGESKIKTNLEADLLLKDGGTIQAMLNKVQQLHTEIKSLSGAMQKVMGSSSGTSGFVKQLQEAAVLMREMKQNAHALGQATANPTAAARNTLISGAAAAGQLQGLKDTLTAEEKLYQLRVAQGKVNINTLLKETDARKLALAQEGLLLRSQTARLSKSREIAAKQLEALKGELQLRKEVAARTKTADAAWFAYERKLEAAEERKVKRDAARAQGVAQGTELAIGGQKTKKMASVAADSILYQDRQPAIDRAVTAAKNKVEKFNLTEQLKAEAIANRNPALAGLQHEQLLAQMKMSNIRLALEIGRAHV